MNIGSLEMADTSFDKWDDFFEEILGKEYDSTFNKSKDPFKHPDMSKELMKQLSAVRVELKDAKQRLFDVTKKICTAEILTREAIKENIDLRKENIELKSRMDRVNKFDKFDIMDVE